ncbi:MAG: hypothetical protein J6M18_04285 [Actinomycetaceae bacterium]|nr:hypothetical protein [Actinomycetaceae bacterium]
MDFALIQTPIHELTLTLYIIGVQMGLYLIFSYLYIKLQPQENEHIHTHFLRIPHLHYTLNKYIELVAKANIRRKTFLILLSFDFLMTTIIASIWGKTLGHTIFTFICGSIVFSGIHYADSTADVRPTLTTYQWSPIKEVGALIIFYAISLSPIAIINLVFHENMNTYIIALNLYITAGILSFVFPSTTSNAHETISTILLIISLIFFAVLSYKFIWSLPLLTPALIAMLTYLVKEETQKGLSRI